MTSFRPIFCKNTWLMLGVCLAVSACSSDTVSTEKVVTTIHGVGVTVMYPYDPGGSAPTMPPLQNLVDGNPNTVWHPSGDPDTLWDPVVSNCSHRIVFVFDRPVYISQILLRFPQIPASNREGDQNRPRSLILTTYPSSDDAQLTDFGDAWGEFLKGSGKTETVSFADSNYSTVLRTKLLDLSVIKCTDKHSSAFPRWADIDFQFADGPRYTGGLDVKGIKALMSRDRHVIHLPDGTWDYKTNPLDPNPDLARILAGAMYWGLKGNREAEKIFMTYEPAGAMSGEQQAVLRHWYKLTKAVNLSRK